MIGDPPDDAEAALRRTTAAAGVFPGEFSTETLVEAGRLAVAPAVGDLISRLRRDRSRPSE